MSTWKKFLFVALGALSGFLGRITFDTIGFLNASNWLDGVLLKHLLDKDSFWSIIGLAFYASGNFESAQMSGLIGALLAGGAVIAFHDRSGVRKLRAVPFDWRTVLLGTALGFCVGFVGRLFVEFDALEKDCKAQGQVSLYQGLANSPQAGRLDHKLLSLECVVLAFVIWRGNEAAENGRICAGYFAIAAMALEHMRGKRKTCKLAQQRTGDSPVLHEVEGMIPHIRSQNPLPRNVTGV